MVHGAANVTIGGSSAGLGNVITGNLLAGVALTGLDTSGVIVEGNGIGTDSTGTGAEANEIGVSIVGATANTIGGTVALARNVISGNRTEGTRDHRLRRSRGGILNVVEGNLIGTNAAGTARVRQ